MIATTISAPCSPKKIYPIPKLSPSVYSDIPFLEIGIDGVVKQLKNIKQNKATGPDELPARVLKETAAENSPNYHTHFSAVIQHFQTSR